MASRKCNTDNFAQRVSVFITECIRNTYCFLTPNRMEQLRNLRNEVEDNFLVCLVITAQNAPWRNRESPRGGDDSEDEDFQPAAKRTRKLYSIP